MFETEIRLQGAPNFRDLGGYQVADGRKVRRGRVFRSEGLSTLTSEDFYALSKLGLRLVCDLRSQSERTKKPTVWPESFVPETVLMDVNADLRAGDEALAPLREDPTVHGATELMLDVYRKVPGVLTKYLGTLFSSLAGEDRSPLVFHCSAGKDRTGIVSAITLLALGVPRDIVYEDYLKTRNYQDVPKMHEQIAEYLVPIYAPEEPPYDVLSALVAVREIYLDEAMTAMGENKGSIEEYLRSAGITRTQTELLRASLLE